MRLACTVLALALVSCTYGRDLQSLCDAPLKAGLSPGDSRDVEALKMARWADGHLQSSEGVKLFRSLGSAPPQEKARILRAEAAAHGVSSCPLADWLDREPKPEPPRPTP